MSCELKEATLARKGKLLVLRLWRAADAMSTCRVTRAHRAATLQLSCSEI